MMAPPGRERHGDTAASASRLEVREAPGFLWRIRGRAVFTAASQVMTAKMSISVTPLDTVMLGFHTDD